GVFEGGGGQDIGRGAEAAPAGRGQGEGQVLMAELSQDLGVGYRVIIILHHGEQGGVALHHGGFFIRGQGGGAETHASRRGGQLEEGKGGNARALPAEFQQTSGVQIGSGTVGPKARGEP